MDKITDFEVKKGVYSVEYTDIKRITLSYIERMEGIVE